MSDLEIANPASMVVWVEMEMKRGRKADRVNPRPPLYLKIPARVAQLLFVILAWALRLSFGDLLAGRG
jgi:hypothetical protein